MSEQNPLNLEETGNVESVEKYKFEPIKGYPMLNWRGKRPFTSTQYYPAQKKEVYGEEINGWINKIFWGDNIQVMSHLLKEFRGKVDLIYIDPPFDSKADYKKKIKLKGKAIANDNNSFEEKQYTDIWTNDEFLQFIFERLTLLRELLKKGGQIYFHCGQDKSHLVRCLLDEVFGANNFINELIWQFAWGVRTDKKWNKKHDSIFLYKHGHDDFTFNAHDVMEKRKDEVIRRLETGNKSATMAADKSYLDDPTLALPTDVLYVNTINAMATERTNYPTQKPEELIKKLILASSNSGDLVFDCFMGSGTTQSVAMQLGRRFIGVDINLGAIQTSTKRLLATARELSQLDIEDKEVFLGFEVLNVNNYDVFRNPVEAKKLLLDALEIEPLSGGIYDGEKDGYLVKVMPVNRIATREDLNELLSNFPYKVFEQRKNETPNKAVESIMLICMGHEPDLKSHLEHESGYKLNVEVVDILRDKANIEFKRDSEAEISTSNNKLEIVNFFPMNLMQKLSLQKGSVNEWRELVESVVIDWNYGGAAMEPTIIDIPAKDEFVAGIYDIPHDAGAIKIKITDLLSESYEEVIQHG